MNKKIQLSIIFVTSGVVGLFFTATQYIRACFKSDCYEFIYGTFAIISAASLIAGTVLLSMVIIVKAKHSRRARLLLLAMALIYLLAGFMTYYYLLGGKRNFNERKFIDNFKTTYFRATELPEGYDQSYLSYSPSGANEDVYGPGNYSNTVFSKSVSGADGNVYPIEFSMLQGDEKNNAAGILIFCGGKYVCDIINGKNIKNIHCRRADAEICSVEHMGTYITISGKKSGLSRQEVLKVIDSLVPY